MVNLVALVLGLQMKLPVPFMEILIYTYIISNSKPQKR